MNTWQRWFPLLSLLLYKRKLRVQKRASVQHSQRYLAWKEQLMEAILADERSRVRNLIEARPIPRPDDRLYGVLVENEAGETLLIVVRPDGSRLGPEELIESAVDVLNLSS